VAVTREGNSSRAGWVKRAAYPADILQQMRILALFLICTIGCLAQRPEDQILAVYKQMEKAAQGGDGKAFAGLWSRESASQGEKMGALLHPQPDLHFTSSQVLVQGDEAVLLGQIGKDQYMKMRLVKQDGSWKIKDQAFSDQAYTADAAYAVVPPAAGAFERAGMPWQNVTPAFNPADSARHGFQVRAAYDESFLYIRIESSKPIPAPGTPAETPPMGWPVMKVGVSGVGEFVLHDTANIGDQATFDKSGRAEGHRHYVAYWLMLERAKQMIFQAWAGPDPDPLIQAGGHFLDVRVPLRTMGVADASRTKITIGDAAWPTTALFSLDAQFFR